MQRRAVGECPGRAVEFTRLVQRHPPGAMRADAATRVVDGGQRIGGRGGRPEQREGRERERGRDRPTAAPAAGGRAARDSLLRVSDHHRHPRDLTGGGTPGGAGR